MIASILLLLGSIAFLIASLGLFRLPDAYARLHAGTKASSFAILLMVAATLFRFHDTASLIWLAGILLMTFVTAPLACHAIASKVYSLKSDAKGSGKEDI